jgi:sigma-B regulation protein RsbU (phosphoserine phosphatase)
MEEELNVGRDIQMSMLPLVFPPFPERSDFSVFAMLEAAREVGGDFYDLFLIDENRFCFCVGDVSGKGVPAALFMAVTKTLLKSRSSFDSSPGSIFTHVNDEMAADNDASMFVTLWMAILDTRTGEVVYSNAGHNPPFVKRADGSLLRLDKLHGPVIGAMEGLPYGEDSVTMRPGDTLFLYTDGVTEAMDPPGDLYGEDRLCEILEEPDHTTVEDLVEASAADVWRFQAEAEQADDVTILAVQYHPAAAALAVFEMAIAPDLQEIDRVNAAVDDFASENTLEDDLRRSLKLAVDELLNNAISYGTPAEHDHKLSVRLERSESHLTLTFRDNGTPFNPLELEAPDTEAPIESREIGGLGIHLVRALADDIRYARDDGWNVLILQKSLTT